MKLAHLIGAKVDEVVLLSNASMAADTVLRNFEWEEEDVLIPCKPFYVPFARILSKYETQSALHTVQFSVQ